MKRIGLAAVLAAACGGAVHAEPPRLYPDFTFRRVKPPTEGAVKRITVQVPAVLPTVPKPLIQTPDVAVPATPGAFGWYWDIVSPALQDGSSGRLEEAVRALRAGPAGAEVSGPRLQHMQQLADDYGIEILKATVGTQVSPALVLAVIGVESGGRAKAVSHAGATGLMQLMPATAERFGVGDSTDPAQNIAGGVAYLDWLMSEFGRDPVLVLAGYNAGEGAVRDNAGVPPYAETRDYVPKVLAAWEVARGICLTPPELVSDGCVFRKGRSG